ncbi:MAG: bifunctional phosphoribosyl-AMP cyclohydrolase/phosphoribosyl-ATP diphosphatase HisIE [Gemmatimonadaceae bacterium]
MLELTSLDFEKGDGIIPVIAQHAVTGAILMLAYMDREALERTIETGELHYRSRSRGLWRKGATSGNTQRLVSLGHDCDGDALLARVLPAGPACHTGSGSCFGDPAETGDTLSSLDALIARRAATMTRDSTPAATGETDARPSYTIRLLGDQHLRLKKLGEESAELITACATDDKARAVEEAADLLYHTLVALRAVGGSLDDVRGVLGRRAGSVSA